MSYVRKSGLLLHPTSLPGPGGIGSLGQEARNFVDFLHSSGQSIWQILPLGPTGFGNSPYACYSAFAGNPLLISLEEIAAEGDIGSDESTAVFPEDRVDYDRVSEYKSRLLRKAAGSFFASGDSPRREEFETFRQNNLWLKDYALFMALKKHQGGNVWCDWPHELALRHHEAVDAASVMLESEIREHEYMQWQFFRQWHRIREYANSRGVMILGDIPIFVAHDSADVWANPQLFQLDEDGRPRVVAGVPPDYFSETGQLWGNPLYDWERVAFYGFLWWIERFRCSLELYDMVRVDHFRGFEAYWEIPVHEKTAVNGRWVKGPGEALFHAVFNVLGRIPLVAEDLGVITPEVEALRDGFKFPGMKILHFAFDSGPTNPYLPHNYVREMVAYTGTHDNDTTLGWFSSRSEEEKQAAREYLKISNDDDIVWEMIRGVMASVAEMSVIPIQDLLCLPSDARMNFPGTSAGNWTWRLMPGALSEELGSRLRGLTEMFGRLAG
jgi:4-alpha-glucanotransferase